MNGPQHYREAEALIGKAQHIAATAALPIAVLLVAVALATNLDGWLAVPVATAGAWVAVGTGLARARWYRRGGAR